MNALVLRNLLFAAIIIIFGATGALIYFASGFLQKETTATTHAKIDAKLGQQDIDKLKDLEKILEANSSSVQKADQIVSESKQYEYQDQIIRDINSYAAKTGVNVTGYDFGDTTTAATAPPAGTQLPAAISGVKTLPVTLTLSSPMPFDNYLRFVKAIEQNLTKMQVQGINITPDAKLTDSISNPSVILIVYVK